MYKVIIGIFSPYRYKIEKYFGYDIKILKNNFRSLVILKNRYGDVGVEHPVLFLGATNTFLSLPKPDSEEIQAVYKKLKTN